MQPRGGIHAHRWQEAREADAAKKVQSRWRSVRSRKTYLELLAEQQREAATRKLQAFARRRKQLRQPNLYSVAAKANPFNQPLGEAELLKHEEEIIKKRKQYNVSLCRGMTPTDLADHAQMKYQEFIDRLGKHRADIGRTVMYRERIKQLTEALEGRSWEKPVPYGISSAALLQDAEEKHKERMRSMADIMWFNEAVTAEADAIPLAIESRTEQLEGDELLHGLERDLGYDFSLGV